MIKFWFGANDLTDFISIKYFIILTISINLMDKSSIISLSLGIYCPILIVTCAPSLLVLPAAKKRLQSVVDDFL